VLGLYDREGGRLATYDVGGPIFEFDFTPDGSCPIVATMTGDVRMFHAP
jgi:hypothetical protein